MHIELPALSLTLLLGQPRLATTEFLMRWFQADEIIDPAADAAWLLETVERRLRDGKFTALSGAQLATDERRELLRIAKRQYVEAFAIVIETQSHTRRAHASLPEGEPPGDASHPRVEPPAVWEQRLKTEGFRDVFVLESEAKAAAAQVTRRPMPTDRRDLRGPFDIIGDVHGCIKELELLLELLGYEKQAAQDAEAASFPWRYAHPDGRTAIFVGDLVDRGPRSLNAVRLALNMAQAGDALAVIGNHDDKARRLLIGHDVSLEHGLKKTAAELRAIPKAHREHVRLQICEFFGGLPSHLLLDAGRLAVVHGGIKPAMLGRDSKRIRDFALYGDTSGETDEFGLPVRYNWAKQYHGDTLIVYGHTPMPQAEWVNNTINLDTGCVFGGMLTALRYPEMALASVKAFRQYAKPRRPLGTGLTDPK